MYTIRNGQLSVPMRLGGGAANAPSRDVMECLGKSLREAFDLMTARSAIRRVTMVSMTDNVKIDRVQIDRPTDEDRIG